MFGASLTYAVVQTPAARGGLQVFADLRSDVEMCDGFIAPNRPGSLRRLQQARFHLVGQGAAAAEPAPGRILIVSEPVARDVFDLRLTLAGVAQRGRPGNGSFRVGALHRGGKTPHR